MKQAQDQTPDAVARRVHSEYIEMPGLQLTFEQAQRLFGLGAAECATVLERLVERNVLMRLPGGRYARASEGGTRGARGERQALDLPVPA
jgi:hypothetical protein